MSDDKAAPDCQRIDKWLWFARLVKTRGLAQRLVISGHVRVNKVKFKKPSQTITTGDVISALVHDRIRILKVVGTGTRRGPATEAQAMYEELGETATTTPDDAARLSA